tara:strand:+ start:48 stop:290 length:243 start_codon:yes stop_codon:yes gene_type:complete
MSVRILVLTTGDVWIPIIEGETEVYTITDDAYERMCYSQDVEPHHLKKHEIIDITLAEHFVLKQGLGQLDDFTTEGVTMN